MESAYKHRVSYREFLNLPGYHAQAFIAVYVEDSSEKEITTSSSGYTYNPQPRVILQMADCSERIQIEIDLSTADQRANSFHKVDTLIEGLTKLREGMEAECKVIRERQKKIDEQKQEKQEEATNLRGRRSFAEIRRHRRT